ncbi:hypothetical protein BsWGS_16272 [Bradybaena similaris]
MVVLCLAAWLVVIQLNSIPAQAAVCPVCTNKYDYNSCTQTQSCGTDWDYCELIVKPNDLYSLEYVCKQALECVDLADGQCQPGVNETCLYCCDDLVTCQLQRDDLYNYVFSAEVLPVQTTPAGGVQTNPPATSITNTTTTKATSAPEGSGIECPVCSDAYDHTTCSGTQRCAVGGDTVCQLVIHANDLLRLEYNCQHYEACVDLEAHGCHPEVNDTCIYCCSEPVTCQIQRDALFTDDLPSLGLPTNVSDTTTITTTNATMRPTATVTRTPQTLSTTSSPTTTPTNPQIRCLQCGNFAERISCTEMDLVLSQPESCPKSLPYCFTSFTQNGTDLFAYKGCATENFCSLEYQISSAKAECVSPDFSSPRHASCGYCCNHHACNAALKPEDSSIVVFP